MGPTPQNRVQRLGLTETPLDLQPHADVAVLKLGAISWTSSKEELQYFGVYIGVPDF